MADKRKIVAFCSFIDPIERITWEERLVYQHTWFILVISVKGSAISLPCSPAVVQYSATRCLNP